MESGNSSRIIPSYELLLNERHINDVVDDNHLHDDARRGSKYACGYTSLKLAPNLSDYFTNHAEWHIKEGVPIWVDAICINQQDPAEVANQILLQAEIYTMAKQTNVWLGRYSRDLSMFEWWQDTVYRALVQNHHRHRQSPHLFDLMFKTGDHLDEEFWLQNFGLAPPDGTTWYECWRSYLYFFLGRRWFSRLWTIQEVMLAQTVYMFCGRRRFNFNDVLQLDRWLLSSFFRAKPRYEPNEVHHEQIWPRWNPGFKFEIIRTRLNYVQPSVFPPDTVAGVSSTKISYLLGILQSVRGQETSFNRDKVLGLVGIAAHFVPRSELPLLVYDPSGSDRDVFVSFARYYIQRDCLDILSYAGHRPAQPSWPSWVPHWDDVSQSGSYELSYCYAGEKSPAAPDARNTHATYSDGHWQKRLTTCVPRVFDETLVLYGVPIGVVAETYPKDEWTQHIGFVMGLLGPTYSLTGEPNHDAIRRTIFRAANDDPPMAERSGAEGVYHQFLLYLRVRLVRNGLANPKFVKDLQELLLSQPSMHPQLSSIVRAALAEINRRGGQVTCHSPTELKVGNSAQETGIVQQSFSNEIEVMQKVFNIFVTTNGVLGNGSKSIKPGHEIWVVENGPVPVILEKGMEAGKFRLIGTAYVHGVMHGEAIRGKRAEEMTELRIV
ncbi:hypothetical protein J7T55_015634 [Diaporthe amygdali]|uniref:uncharacterized protein n=1 Tax=Phomopsis amygdali TaxID=1214568 RepID=UPI0022FDBECA|nr:uncharacterized protein J7T55_015634 [Diaporthe amygdali]KAJ0120896.1 hypothetical protein J7T55_015634 [Diaporthe amygdali]